MYYIALCDDNIEFLNLLSDMLEKEFGEIVSPKYKIAFEKFNSGRSLLDFAKKQKISVLFLDIDMPEMTGFDVAKVLGNENKDMLIIFVSAYDNFVYESFDYSPFQFIRKSRLPDDLKKIVTRINDKLFAPIKHIELQLLDESVNIDIKKILYFESEKNYYSVHLMGGEKLIGRGTMNSIEEKVKDLDFYRIHSGFVVNLEHAGRITHDGFLTVGHAQIPISQKRMKDFKKVYSEYARRSAGLS